MKEQYIKELLRLCKKAFSKNEMPVSALIVKDNKIISKAYNFLKKSKKFLDVCLYADIYE